MMDRATFYKSLRRRESHTFGTSLSQGQVNGLEAILDAGQGYPLSHLAYALATARGEVGPRMQPVSENLNYRASQIGKVFSKRRLQGKTPHQLARNPKALANTVYGGPWGAEHLGNTQEGDGWRFRGRGFPQATGRRNYKKLSVVTGLDLVGDPDLMLRLDVASQASLFGAMKSGLYTGKAFHTYLPEGKATFAQYKAARRIINGQFHASKIAGFAVDFQIALVSAEYQP